VYTLLVVFVSQTLSISSDCASACFSIGASDGRCKPKHKPDSVQRACQWHETDTVRFYYLRCGSNSNVALALLPLKRPTRFPSFVNVRITAEWRGAALTSGLGVVLGLDKPKRKRKPSRLLYLQHFVAAVSVCSPHLRS